MIGKLKGLIDSYGEDFVILDVNGVGYVVQCSSRTLQKLPKAGEAAALAIETQVREDAIRLFGFASDAERDWFRLLQSVQGVGSKVALAVLSTLTPGELANAIALRPDFNASALRGLARRSKDAAQARRLAHGCRPSPASDGASRSARPLHAGA